MSTPMPNMPDTRLRLRLAVLALVLMLGAGAGAASAQTWTPYGGVPEANPDGAAITFETVGDQPVDAETLAFDSTGTLYAADDAFRRLPPGGTVWETLPYPGVTDAIVALRPDTLIRAGVDTERSLDGGLTWGDEFEEGGGALYQAPDGTLLTAMPFEDPGVARSTDRGVTWTPSPFVGDPDHLTAKAFLALPDDHALAPGRMVAGVYAGLAYSDDGGATWDTSDVWQHLRFSGDAFALAPDGSVLAVVTDGAFSGRQLYGSADGASWEHFGAFHDPPDTALVGRTRLVAGHYGWALSDGSVLVVTGRGFVWRSFDGGQSWGLLDGRVPLTADGYTFVSWALVGPDGRLYVAVDRTGATSEGAWVYRSTEAVLVAVASEPGLPEPPEESGVRLEVRPNPSRGGAETTFVLAAPSKVTLVLYDALGRRVAVLAEGAYTAGRHTVPLATETLPAGVYVVRLEVGDAVRVRRLTLVR